MKNNTVKIGDIFIYSLPFIGKSEKKTRPVLVVSEPNSKGDVAVLAGSSKITKWNERFQVIVKQSDLISGNLNDVTVFPASRHLLARPEFFHVKLGSLKNEKREETLKALAYYQTTNYYMAIHKPAQTSVFIPGKSRIPYAGRVFDEKEMINLVDSSLDFWLTTGKYAEKFEKKFAEFMGVKHCSLTNSGSSANLLAFMALTSPKLGERRIQKGDEVITVAAGFPTTVSPIIQYGAVPVFVDVTIPEYNIDCTKLEDAVSEKTKAVFLAHTMGNPFDVEKVMAFCEKYNLWLIEDNCDALGSQYKGKLTSTFGHIATQSFYPPHHMTMGEGGAVITNDPFIKKLVESLRDWGRDCWCPSGHDNTCSHRFDQQFGEIPYGYDHKYVYSHFGYNLKVTDMQAAIGCAQLEKLPSFIEARKRNWKMLRDGLSYLVDKFILPEPTEGADPSWFGFLLTVKEEAGFTRDDIVKHLESKGIQTRMLFAGNLIKHPCFDEMRKSGQGFRVVNSPSHAYTLSPSVLPVTDRIMRDTFWVGVFPGMTEGMIEFMLGKIKEFSAG